MAQPEQQARQEIDRLLEAAGWRVFDLAAANILAVRGVATYEEPHKLALGGVQPNLNLSLVRSIRFPFSALLEQHRIVAEVDRQIATVRETDQEIATNQIRALA